MALETKPTTSMNIADFLTQDEDGNYILNADLLNAAASGDSELPIDQATLQQMLQASKEGGVLYVQFNEGDGGDVAATDEGGLQMSGQMADDTDEFGDDNDMHLEPELADDDEDDQFLCHQCGMHCLDLNDLVTHLEDHSGGIDRRFHCHLCNKSYSFSKDLRLHLRKHTGEKPYSCNLCGEFFDRTGKLARHKLYKHGVTNLDEVGMTHRCPVCERVFKDLVNMKQHFSVHTREKNYQCGECEKRFRTDRDLTAHMQRWHSGDECLHVCDVCDKSYKIKAVLNHHMRGPAHRRNLIRKMQEKRNAEAARKQAMNCLTGSGMRSKAGVKVVELQLTGHTPLDARAGEDILEVVVENDGIGQEIKQDLVYSCNYCESQFTDYEEYVAHDRRHRCERPFPCDQCSHMSVSDAELQEHVRVKHGPFPCEYCQQIFPQKNTLLKHIQQVHFGVRKYHCSVCGLGCTSPEGLRRHYMRRHTAEDFRPFQCNTCDRDFKTLHDLKRHTRIHEAAYGSTHLNPIGRAPPLSLGSTASADGPGAAPQSSSEQQWICVFCGKVFNRQTLLFSHLKNVHNHHEECTTKLYNSINARPSSLYTDPDATAPRSGGGRGFAGRHGGGRNAARARKGARSRAVPNADDAALLEELEEGPDDEEQEQIETDEAAYALQQA